MDEELQRRLAQARRGDNSLAQRSSSVQETAPAQFPMFLSPRPVEVEQKLLRPLVTALVAYLAAFVAMRVAGIALSALVVAGGFFMGDGDPARDALVAALTVIAVLTVVAVLASAVVLKLFGVRSPVIIGFVGVAADFVFGTIGNQVSGFASYALGGLADVSITYVLVMRQARERRQEL